MGCCSSIKSENTEFQISMYSFSMKHTNEFNEVCLDSLPKGDDTDKKLNTTFSSAGSANYLTSRKDLESAFLMPTVGRLRY
ncbi:hypothetical protein SteCoe_37638 [Stentor coeruleus]|uniref:Uncharacterized protein n=1 Tax=Stentor coeruleus TaxID=5963 RepID=A0A1R2AMP4_9CILI|nr:hypothetical protein SteCoe_37638 [Stentor coeruleus]